MGSLRDELVKVREARGVLTPAVLVEEATPEDHPLHDRFEWDNKVAGHRYRVQQAHELIQVVRMTFVSAQGKDTSIRAFQAVRTELGHEYVPTEDVASDPTMTSIVLMDMKREWKTLQLRYGHFKEFVEMVSADIA